MGPLASICKNFTSIDIYGYEIKLLYKGKDKKPSFVGAIFTTLTVALITLYFAYQLKDINENKADLKSLTLDVNTNEVIKTVKQEDFDLAFVLERYDEEDYEDLQLFNYTFASFINGDRKENSFTFSKCAETRFNKEPDFKEILESNNEYDMTTNCLNFEKGMNISQLSKASLLLEISECDQKYLSKMFPGKKCETDEDIINPILAEAVFKVIRTNK